MLATTAIGAIWACCSPDFGERGVLDRFVQLAPTVLFCVDGYRYGGKEIDRRDELRRIRSGLDSVRHAVLVPNLRQPSGPAEESVLLWDDLLNQPPVPRAEFRFEQVPFDHPLWTLFSSGTTGLPKPIVHGHGGILLETLKNGTFHFDLHPDDRLMFFTTSGWMLWNFLIGSMLTGAIPVLYDGNPAFPEQGCVVESGRPGGRVNVRVEPDLRGPVVEGGHRAARALSAREPAQRLAGRLAGDARMHGLVLPATSSPTCGWPTAAAAPIAAPASSAACRRCRCAPARSRRPRSGCRSRPTTSAASR